MVEDDIRLTLSNTSHAECDETMVHLDFLFETGSLKIESVYTFLKEFTNL